MLQFRAVWWQWAVMFTFLITVVAGDSPLSPATVGLAMVAAAAVLAGGVGTVRLAAVSRVAASLPAVRDRHHRTVFIPQCDPDAAGRPRPRAPGA